MSDSGDNLGSFFKDSARLVKDYFETRLEIFRLRAVKLSAKSAGFIIWVIISLFLFFVFIIFAGIVLGLWMSRLTGSDIAGFGITCGIILVLLLLLALLRKKLFVNPLIRAFLQQVEGDDGQEEEP